jgi:hypothetical protein
MTSVWNENTQTLRKESELGEVAEQKSRGLPEDSFADREASRERSEMSCKTRYIGNEELFECLAKNPKACRFSQFVAHFYLCRSPHKARFAEEPKA